MKGISEEEVEIGIEQYATEGGGAGGRIRASPEDFVVSEVLTNDARKLISKRGLGGFPLYVLRKSSTTTLEALEEISREVGASANVLGLKDKKALTFQFISLRIRGEPRVETVRRARFQATCVAKTERPLKRSDLLGNFFRIRIRDFSGRDEDIWRIGELLDKGRLPNFFGPQRFGRDVPNHRIGEAIVKKNFSRAAEILTGRLLSEGDALAALRRVPLRVRRLFVQAYQSFLFNKALSRVLSKTGELERRSALYVGKHPLLPYVDGTFLRSPTEVKDGLDPVPLLQLPGYSFRDKGDTYSRCTVEVMAEEGVTSRDFFVKEAQELSAEGGFRPACMVGWFKGARSEKTAEINFGLYSGCYATTLLRELMKPESPSAAGF
jgi:tRNA pseudouridine13 synthase